MVARSTTRSNQRPDTLMQDRSPPPRRKPLATHGRTIHRGQNAKTHFEAYVSALPPITDIHRQPVRQAIRLIGRRFRPVFFWRARARSLGTSGTRVVQGAPRTIL